MQKEYNDIKSLCSTCGFVERECPLLHKNPGRSLVFRDTDTVMICNIIKYTLYFVRGGNQMVKKAIEYCVKAKEFLDDSKFEQAEAMRYIDLALEELEDGNLGKGRDEDL